MGLTSDGKVRCTSCQKTYAWQDKYAGLVVRCHCGKKFAFPDQCPGHLGVDGSIDHAPCPSCHKPVRQGAVLCVNCGYNLQQGSRIATDLGVQVTYDRQTYDKPVDRIAGKLRRSCLYAQMSFAIVGQHKKLLLFPLFSVVASLLVLVCFAIPIMQWQTHADASAVPTVQLSEVQVKETLTQEELANLRQVRENLTNAGKDNAQQIDVKIEQLHQSILDRKQAQGQVRIARSSLKGFDYIILFTFYFCNYALIVFFNTALFATSVQVIDGQIPSLSYGLKAAWRRLPQILAWALIAALVGVWLKSMENISEKLRAFIEALLGASWTVMTYFTIPFIVSQGLDPIGTLGQSLNLLQDRWGDAAVGNFSMGLLAFVVTLPVYLLLAVVSFGVLYYAPSLEAVAVIVIMLVLITVIFSALSSLADTVFKALLYNFTIGRKIPVKMDEDKMAQAFAYPRNIAKI